MLHIRLRARSAINGNITRLFIKRLTVLMLRAMSLFVLLLPVMCIFYSVQDVFYFVPPYCGYILAGVFLAASAFLFFASYMAEAEYKAAVSYLQDRNLPCPHSFFTFRQGKRYLELRICVFLMKFLWRTVFFFPCGFLSLCLFVGANSGDMLKVSFFVLLTADILLFVSGVIFSYVVCGRYYLCDFLFCTNPLTDAKNILSSSVYITGKRLIRLSVMRLSFLPWYALIFTGVSVVFCSSFIASLKTELSREIYGEKRCMKKNNAVVFFIGKHSVIREAGAV